MNNQPDSLDRKALLKNALIALDEMQSRIDAIQRSQHEPIAIIGMGCRFPGDVTNPDDYWQLLLNGVDAVRQVPTERWNIHDFDDLQTDKPIAWYGGFLNNIDQFYPQFFGISPREANAMDPQQRMVLEASWEALEHAGQRPDKLAGSQTGVFVGATTNDYSQMVRSMDPSQMDVYAATGSALNAIPGRVAYTLGLHGPSISVDTACSSSLVAIHLACRSLRNKECDLALAGGVNATLTPEAFICFAGWGMMAPDGHCKTFDSNADGFVRGEGCGMLVLKRLSDALEAGDRIQAIIRGSAVNQDGRSSGLTVPNGRAQQAVIRLALKDAGITPAQVSYVETHGTGTALGDPIEVEAIGAAFADGRTIDNPLTIGSVKTNIGHLESASGIAGLIKTVLAMQHRLFPPHLHLKERSPRIPWPSFPIEIPDQPTPWLPNEGGRIAGVSSFGFSGTNAHIILEEAPQIECIESQTRHSSYLLPLSAKTEAALNQLASRYGQRLTNTSEIHPAQICRTTALGRTPFNKRLAVTGETVKALQDGLAAFASGQVHPAVITGQAERSGPGKIAFLFTGQGSQWVQMGRQLYENQPVFRQALDTCDELLRPYLPESLLSILFAPEDEQKLLDHTSYTQPALFALQYSLVQLWKSFGIQPSAVLGHSVGEYAAACAAGVFSLADGIRLIATRARLMGDLPPGGQMAAVFASEDRLRPFLTQNQVSIAAVNGLENTVISGSQDEVQAVLETLRQEGIEFQMLQVSHAFHSVLMDPILDRFEQTALSVQFSAPSLTLISNVTGQPETDLVCAPEYWRKHIRQPVRFQQGIQALYEAGYRIFVEIGPHPVLNGMAQRCLAKDDSSLIWLASLRKSRGDEQQILESLGALWVRGAPIDWSNVYQDAPITPVDLPTYPFQRERYWLEETPSVERKHQKALSNQIHPLLGSRLSSPLHLEKVIETRLSINWPPCVNDHRLTGRSVFPGTGNLEMGMAVGKHILKHENFFVENLSIINLLNIPENQEKVVQTIISMNGTLPFRFQIYSLEDAEEEKWILHAEGMIAAGVHQEQNLFSLTSYRERCTEQIAVQDYYKTLDAVGLGYGVRFRCLQEIWRIDYEAFGEIALPVELVSESKHYSLHPGLLDSCFQLMGAALPKRQEDEKEEAFYVPVAIGSYQLHRSAVDHLFAYITLDKQDTDSETLIGKILLFDQESERIGSIDDLQIRKITRSFRKQPARESIDLLYQKQWVSVPIPTAASISAPSGNWIIIENDHASSEVLVEHLRKLDIPAYVYSIDQIVSTDGVENFHSRLEKIIIDKQKKNHNHFEGIVFLCGNSPHEIDTLDNLRDIQRQIVNGLVSTAQSVLRIPDQFSSHPLFIIVTNGAQAVITGDMLPGYTQSAVWGIGRTIAQENPNLKCICVDLDPSEAVDVSMKQLADSIKATATENTEDHIAFRSHARYAARLVKMTSESVKEHTNQTHPFVDHMLEKPFKLTITKRGVLDNIEWHAATLPSPDPWEIVIRVQAAGLNFRDVLNVLGLLPGAEIGLGHECAGRVIAVGESVTHFKVGDEVMGIASGSFGTYAITHQDLAVKKPANINIVEAATIPLAFLTAHYALIHLAQLKKGERVLIHSAAGGVGMAAVQIALRAGAEIFATAGTPEKRALLQSIGVHHVMDSRSLIFANQIMELTNHEGVDVILNSLIDEFISKSFSVLKPGGQFLEIGKRGIWSHEQVDALAKGHKYHIIFIGEVCANSPALIKFMLEVLAQGISSNDLKPLPFKVFPIKHAVEAFRYMAQAKHIGKIVLTYPIQPWTIAEQGQTTLSIRQDASYLITGGLGGIGLKITGWLVAKGARSIALVGRNAPSQEVASYLEQIRRSGVQITMFQGDIAVEKDVQRVLAVIQDSLPPLAGIFHAAAVLNDGLFLNQEWDDIESVLAPKVYGAWNLHVHTLNIPLDFFILFSAGASVFGSPGQSNYAGANAFLDSLAYFRHARGLPALSINWGPWGEVGMAARLSHTLQLRWENQGIHLMAPDKCLEVMENLISSNLIQAGVFDIDWAVFLHRFPVNQQPPFYQDLSINGIAHPVSQLLPAQEKNILAVLASATPGDRIEILEKHIKGLIGQVIGHRSPDKIPNSATLTELGIDSLMAIELRNRIQNTLEIDIPLSMFFGANTVTDLRHRIAMIIWTPGEMQLVLPQDNSDREDFQV